MRIATYRVNPTKDRPLLVVCGDVVRAGGGAYEEVISRNGLLWLDGDQWAGRALLAEPSPETLRTIPPHIRALAGVLHFPVAKDRS